MPGQTTDEEMTIVQDSSWLNDEFVITNLSTTHVLDYRVYTLTFEPEEVRVVVSPEFGSVPPGGNVAVSVRFDTHLLADIDDFRGDDLSGKLVVQDRNVTDTEVEVDINVNMTGWDHSKRPAAVDEDGDPSLKPRELGGKIPSHQDQLDRLAGFGSPDALSDGARDSPVISQEPAMFELGLHGCTPAAYSTHRYDVDVGQQGLSADKKVEWELTISNPNPRAAVEYRVRPICLDTTQGWLALSHTGATVESMVPSQVKLMLRTNQIGRFSAYLLLENLSNPEDVKTVRVRMEVVANYSKVRQEKLFNVVIDGTSTDESSVAPVINLGACFRGRLYRHRSFLLQNSSDIPLDFIIKSPVADDEDYDLDFSSTNTSLKKMTAVTVGPRSYTNVFIFYRIHHQSNVGDRVHSVYISCRLVRDYQLTITLHAECCEPCLGIASRKQLHFKAQEFTDFLDDDAEDGTISPGSGALTGSPEKQGNPNKGGDGGRLSPTSAGPPSGGPVAPIEGGGLDVKSRHRLRFDPPHHDITITNLSNEPTEVTICNGTMFFVIRGVARSIEDPDAPAQAVTFTDPTTGGPTPTKSREASSNDGSLSPLQHRDESPRPTLVESASTGSLTDGGISPGGASTSSKVVVDETTDVGAVGGIVSGERGAKQLRAWVPPGCELVIIVEPNRQSITKMYEQIMKEKYVEEHLTVYSRANPKEHRWTQLRMLFIREHTSEMDEVIEFFSTAGRSQAYPFQVLEESVVQFLREFKAKVDRWVATSATEQKVTAAARQLSDVTIEEGGGDDEEELEESVRSVVGYGYGSGGGAATASAAAQKVSTEDLKDLLFELHYITDELVYFALKDPVGAGFVFQVRV